MSYMNHNAAFAPAGGIEELSFQEVEQVGGGVPMLVGVVIAIYGPPAVKATVAAVSFAAGAALVYSAAHDD